MKRFYFRFKTIFDVKKTLEELKKKELSEIQALLRAEEALLKQFLDDEVSCQDLLSSKLNAKCSGAELVSYREYATALAEAIENQRKNVSVVVQAFEEKRIELLTASKEKKVFENLEKRDLTRYKYDVGQEELRFIDEVAVTHYRRAKSA